MMNQIRSIRTCLLISTLLLAQQLCRANLLAYEPFTNATGAAIIGSADGLGFSAAWQAHASGGVATNTDFGLTYSDANGNQLTTSGGAGFFQGLTNANTSIQIFRALSFSRGTNGTDGTSTWISFIIARGGLTTNGANPYPRGANVDHDFATNSTTSTTYVQKLAVGGSSGATSNTVGLIPAGSGTNLKPSTNAFGGATNFIVVKIDHLAGAADNAFLFINPPLNAEPSTNSAATNSVGAFDYSFDRVRIFAGGQNTGQPYAELIVDEYRIGETFADVAPYASTNSNASTNLIITNSLLIGNNFVFYGSGGSNNAPCLLLASTNIFAPLTNWTITASNQFDAAGRFTITNSSMVAPYKFFRVRIGTNGAVSPVAPAITAQPVDLTLSVGQNANFNVTATGTAPLTYRWFFNTNTTLLNATNASLIISNAQLANAGKYSVTITNAGGSTNSVYATLTVTNVAGAPVITTQPTNQIVGENSNATFTVVATGTALAYQWFFNTNTVLVNATNASLLIANAQTTNAGGYSVRVTNTVGAVTSVVATLTVNPFVVAGGFYVATNGSDSNPGSLASPYKTISKGLTAIGTGGIMYLRGGTFAQASKLSLSKSSTTNRIRIWAYPGEQPVVNFSGDTSDGFSISGDGYYFKGIEVKLAGHNGFGISGNSNILENCVAHDNANTGIHITGSTDGVTYPAYNLITNCDSYLNFDSPIGGNADGFSAKWQVGPGNIFSGCRSYNNSDDGWDFWMASSTIIIENCWAFRNGSNVWASATFDGNGNGIKLGGNYIGTPHIVRNCVSFENAINGSSSRGRGFDENNNLSGQTVYNCTAFKNDGEGYYFNNTITNGNHTFRNCVAYQDTVTIASTSGHATVADHNSWNGFTVTAADFQNLDTSTATNARATDGSLPVLPMLRLAPGSSLIDAGTNVGLPFNGSAPDLGAFESP